MSLGPRRRVSWTIATGLLAVQVQAAAASAPFDQQPQPQQPPPSASPFTVAATAHPDGASASSSSDPARGWATRAAEATTAAGWAIGRFLRSGLWNADAAFVFERDSRDSDTEVGTFGVSRSTVRTNAAVRNSTLVLGPRTLIGNLGLDVALVRDGYAVNGASSPGMGHVVGYDLGLTVLPDRSYSGSVFAGRTRTRMPRVFGTAREQQVSRRGAVARLRGLWLDSTLDWTEVTIEAEARTGPGVLRDGERRRTLSYVGTRQSERQSVEVSHRRERFTDLIFSAFSFPLETTLVRHALTLDADTHGRTVTSTLSRNRRGAGLSRDYVTAETRLDYQLRRSLDSRAAYRVDRIVTASLSSTRQTADLRLQHRLYESLTTTLSARGATDHLSTGERTLVGGALIVDYRKRLLGGGRLSAVVGRRYDRDDNRFLGRESVVLDEPHVARLGAPFRLQLPRVVAGSVIVTAPAQPVIFVEAFDYVLVRLGDVVEIRILPEGRIQDGQTVVVDYRVDVAPLTATLTAQPRFDLSVDYGWIASYFQTQRTDRSLLSGVDDGTVYDNDARTVGLRLRRTLGPAHLAFRSARRREHSPYLAYTATDIGQSVSWALGPGRLLIVDAEQAETDFRVPLRRETRRSARADVRWQVRPLLAVQASAYARQRRDSLGADETFTQASVEARWTDGTLDTFVSVGRDRGTQDGRSSGGFRVSIGMTRSF